MTVVADLVARMRLEGGDFASGLNAAETQVKGFGREVAAAGEHVGRLKDLAGISATAIGGTFVASVAAATVMTKSYANEVEALSVQFNALFGSSAAGSNQVAMVEDFAQKMGVGVAQVANMSKALQLATQGMHDSQADWAKMNDIAAAHGVAVDAVADSYARAFEIMQRAELTGSGGGTMATRGLLGQHLITPETAAEVEQLINHGADMNKVWATMTADADKFKGAGEAAAKTLSGLTSSFHTLLEGNVGEAFMPLEEGVKHVLAAINDLLRSSGMRQIVDVIKNDLAGVVHSADELAQHIAGFSSRLSGSGFGATVEHLKSMGLEFGALTGLVAEFSTEFIGALPIINRFAGPFKALVEDGRGGLLGLVVASAQGREALMNLASAVGDLLKALFSTGGALGPVLEALASGVAIVINFTAAVIDFVAQHQGLLAFAAAILVVWEALRIGSAVISGVKALIAFFDGIEQVINNYVAAYGKKKAAEMEGDALTRKQVESTAMLSSTMERLAMAIRAATDAQMGLNAAQSEGAGAASVVAMRSQQAASAQSQVASGILYGPSGNVLAFPGTAAPEEAAAPRSMGMGGWGMGLSMAAMVGGGILAQQGLSHDNTAMTVGGSALAGAGTGVGFGMLAGPEGALIGGGLGAAIGGLTGLFTQLGSATDHLKDRVNAAAERVHSYDTEHYPVTPNDAISIASHAAGTRAHADDMNAQATSLRYQAAAQANAFIHTKASGESISKEDKGTFKHTIEDLNRLQGTTMSADDWMQYINAGYFTNPKAPGYGAEPNSNYFGRGVSPGDGNFFKKAGYSPGTGDIDQGYAEADKADEWNRNQKALIGAAAHSTRMTTSQVSDVAKNIPGLNLEAAPDSKEFAATLAQLEAAVGGGMSIDQVKGMGGYSASQYNALASSFAYMPGMKGLQSIAGQEGEKTFTIPAAMLRESAGTYGGQQDVGLLNQYANMGLGKYFGKDAHGDITGESLSQMESERTLISTQMALRQATNAVADANYGLIQAHHQVAQAEHARVKALQGLEDAMRGIMKSQLELMHATFDLGVEQATNANALAHFAQATQGHTDTYWNFSTTVMKLTGEHVHLADGMADVIAKASGAQNRLDDLNLTYKAQSDQLAVLSDRQKQYQDIMSRPLSGETAYDKQLRANTNAQDQIKLQMDALKLQGIYDKDPRMTALQYQLNVLSTQRDTIESHKDLDIGAKQDAIKFASQKDMEVPFAAALKAAESYGSLNKEVNQLTQHLDVEKVKIDEAQKALDQWKTKADLMVQALDAIGSSDQSLVRNHERLSDATWAVHKAFIGMADAQYTVKDADYNIQVANKGVELAGRAVQDAQDSARIATISAATTAATESQKMLTQTGNFMKLLVGGAGDDMSQIFTRAMANLPPDVQAAVKKWLDGMAASNASNADSRLVHPSRTSAEGNIFGGGDEDHSPRIFGTVHGQRVFNEPETGGEAYIPLGANKRSTALPILQQVNALMGVQTFAQGGFSEALGLARDNAIRTGIPVSVMLTQSAFETGNWTSYLWRSKNNPAGLAAYSSSTGGGYPSPAAGWASYADHLMGIGEGGQGKFVADLRGGASPLQLLMDIEAGPWAAGHYGGHGLERTYPTFAGYDMPGLQVPPNLGVDTGPGRPSVASQKAAEAATLATGMAALPIELGVTAIEGFTKLVKPAVMAIAGIGVGTVATNAINLARTMGALGGGIPHYGDGGLALTPHLAMVGERPEAILPLDKMQGLGPSITIADGAISVDIVVHGNAPDDIADEVRDAVSDALHNLVSSVRAKAG